MKILLTAVTRSDIPAIHDAARILEQHGWSMKPLRFANDSVLLDNHEPATIESQPDRQHEHPALI